MGKTDLSNIAPELTVERINAVRSLVSRYHDDPDYRRQMQADPISAFREVGIELPDHCTFRVEANTSDKIYVVMPPDPNAVLDDEALAAVAGSGTTGSAGSLGSASSVIGPSSVPSSYSTLSSAGTAGTF